MAVAYRSKSGQSFSGNDNNGVTMTEPSGAAQDDILLCTFVTTAVTFGSIPTGWTSIYSHDAPGASFYNARAFWIRRGSSAPSYAVTWTASSFYFEWVIVAYSGVKTTGNPYGTSGLATAGVTSANPANPNPPSVTNDAANAMNVVMGMGWAGVNGSTWGTPSGYTARETGLVTGASISCFEKSLSGVGAEDCAAITGSNTGASHWSAFAMALEDAGGGGGGTTRGRPFGTRGTAFNGGRTFGGIIARPSMRQTEMIGASRC